MDGNVRCRDRNSCPGGEVIWCVNVYHPVENIEACFSDGKLVNATDAALNLNLPQYFDSQVCSQNISKCVFFFSMQERNSTTT